MYIITNQPINQLILKIYPDIAIVSYLDRAVHLKPITHNSPYLSACLHSLHLPKPPQRPAPFGEVRSLNAQRIVLSK